MVAWRGGWGEVQSATDLYVNAERGYSSSPTWATTSTSSPSERLNDAPFFLHANVDVLLTLRMHKSIATFGVAGYVLP
jgi:hypothetical protein